MCTKFTNDLNVSHFLSLKSGGVVSKIHKLVISESFELATINILHIQYTFEHCNFVSEIHV
jgi:hypothetical protein